MSLIEKEELKLCLRLNSLHFGLLRSGLTKKDIKFKQLLELLHFWHFRFAHCSHGSFWLEEERYSFSICQDGYR